MEYIREQHFQYYKDTNKATTKKKFETLPDLLDFLHGASEDDRVLREVIEWVHRNNG